MTGKRPSKEPELSDEVDLDQIERILGYHFFEREHLRRALTHPAYAHELLQQNRLCMNQEAYSTLGDAVLKTGLILFLMEKGMQTASEITRTKEALESNAELARVGRRLKIRTFIRLGRGAQGLIDSGEDTILADTLEALTGAIFLDSDADFGVVSQCIGKWFEPELHELRHNDRNAKAGQKTRRKKEAGSRMLPKPARKPARSPEKVPTIPERIVPVPVTPPSSSRREAPTGTRSGSRQRSKR